MGSFDPYYLAYIGVFIGALFVSIAIIVGGALN